MAVVLALLSAIVYGAADYFGGRNSRRFAASSLALGGELVMLVGFAALALLSDDITPTGSTVLWSLLAGVGGSLGVLGLYFALAKGNMTVVAPITGVVAALLPVGVGLATGERPGTLAIIGIALAVGAVAVVGGLFDMDRGLVAPATVLLAVVVGALFGLLFTAYAQIDGDAGWWPIAIARVSGVPILSVAVALDWRRRGRVPFTGGAWLPAAMIGLLGGAANGFYLAASRRGLLSIVAVVVALYPATTVMLAAWLDHERPSRSQLIGMVGAAVAVALVTTG
ncbi:MAG TPA: EamA family transporter [Ilumatobacter sp.]|nr:EamA family transporter [Ilumatobacter sp.]